MTQLDETLLAVDNGLEETLERLFALLRKPSISTDPAYATALGETADGLVADLASIGFDASRRDTTGHPMVVAHGGEGDPHVLFYGHYDVQPVDPLTLWHHDPFDPAIEDRAGEQVIRGRGSSDDKGQLMTFVEACRAWVAVHGALPCRITIFLEGEEESGSPSLIPFMKENAKELTADIALICDTGMWDRETPSICTSLRGLMGEEIIIEAASRDLHSGAYGGPAANPIRVLTKILANLHDETGRVTLPGFYDGVVEPSDDLLAQWDGLGFDESAFLGAVGLADPAGEKGRRVLEMIWTRPTCEFNGITGGYTGDGFKTVLPAQASAKVSCRLVGDQDPHAIRAALHAHVEAHLPADCSVRYIEHGSSKGTTMRIDDPAFEKARGALSDEWGKPAIYEGGGGSIPVAGHFKDILGMDSMLIGFAHADDQIHSPNEKYNVTSFHKGIRSWVRVLAALSAD
ncbi:MAG: M20/M25/M40 family metallo-hydrolase [Pseudomonadota bacterium]